MRKYDVMLAGVSELNAAGLRTVLSSRAFDLEFHEMPGSNAIALTGSDHPAEIMILDMSHGSGKDLIHAIAFLRKYRRQKTILITETLSESVFATLVALGAKAFITPETALDEIPGIFRTVAVGDSYFTNSKYEIQPMPRISVSECAVIEHLGHGRTTKQISDILGVPVKTVETTRCRLLRKTGTRNTCHLLAFAFRNHLLRPIENELSRQDKVLHTCHP